MFDIRINDETFGFWTRVVDKESYIRTDMGVVSRNKSRLVVCWVYWDGGLAIGELDREDL
jgi:hypothetical protein